MIRCLLPLLLGFLFCTCGRAQASFSAFLQQNNFIQDTLSDQSDVPLEYLAAIGVNRNKLVIYCTGSLPVPIFFKDQEAYYNTLPFPVSKLTETHDFVVASKPGVPLVADKRELNENYQFVDADGRFPTSYTEQNYLDYYVATTKALIRKLLREKDYEQLVIMGHSQGARVAAKVAASSAAATHLVYLAGNPLGRYDQLIREKREAALVGRITEEQAHEEIGKLYARWRQINADPESLNTKFGDSNKTWISFSTSTLEELRALEIPLFVGYGTRDIVARYCDLLPLDFISAGKDHLLTLRAYPGYNHSFYPLDADGRVDFSKRGFLEVIEEVLAWLEK